MIYQQLNYLLKVIYIDIFKLNPLNILLIILMVLELHWIPKKEKMHLGDIMIIDLMKIIKNVKMK